MINGRVNRVMDAARLQADRELQQRLLGVGQHGQAEPAEEAAEAPVAAGEGRPAGQGARPGPRLRFKPDNADALVAAGPHRPDRNRGTHAHGCTRAGDERRGAGGRAAADPPRRRGAGDCRRNARHQRRRTPFHSRPDRRRRRARDPGRSFHFRRTLAGRRAAAPYCSVFSWRAKRRLQRRTRRRDHCDGRGVRGLDSAAGTGRRPHFCRRIRRQFAGRAGHARASDRRAESPHLIGCFGQCRALCGPRPTS